MDRVQVRVMLFEPKQTDVRPYVALDAVEPALGELPEVIVVDRRVVYRPDPATLPMPSVSTGGGR